MRNKLPPLLRYNRLVLITIVAALCVFFSGCQSCQNNQSRSGSVPGLPVAAHVEEDSKIAKSIFLIENSESMFGYVNGNTQYVQVVAELAEKADFAREGTAREFFFVNGGDSLDINPIGNSASFLSHNLNIKGFNCGDITKSNLNGMFKYALNKASGDTIVILISDGIYDMGGSKNPLQELEVKSVETRSTFIQKLGVEDGNFQTLLIKLNSEFNGNFFFSSKSGKQWIYQSRPYYIWIFGKSQLLDKYYSEEYISENLPGYESLVRFFTVSDLHVPFQATASNLIGTFMFDRNNFNKLIRVKPTRNFGFQFDIAVDFKNLSVPESYRTSLENFTVNNPNFVIKNVYVPQNTIHGVIGFTASHLITVFTDRSPYGFLEITLDSNTPGWIAETSTEDESAIATDTIHTFGFQSLTNGISGAYEYINKGKSICKISIEISK